jgi:integrase/recombinase XerD
MQEIEQKFREFTLHLKAQNFTEATIQTRAGCLRFFLGYCRKEKVSSLNQVTSLFMESYMRYLHAYRKTDGAELSTARKRNLLITLNIFFEYLWDKQEILINPMDKIRLMKKERNLPKSIFSRKEIVRILNAPDTLRYSGLRDRAILELLYSTGLRAHELISLKIYDIDQTKQTVFVRKGKMQKDRFVPLGNRALRWVRSYITFARKNYQSFVESDVLFLDLYGKPLRAHTLDRLILKYKNQAKVTKRGKSHVFRHAMATHMLEGGADVRYVQEMLGHASVETTQVYTHVAQNELREKYRAIETKLYAGKEALADLRRAESRRVG